MTALPGRRPMLAIETRGLKPRQVAISDRARDGHSVRVVLLLLATALALFVFVAESLVAAGPLTAIWQAYLFPALGALYCAAGLIAWSRRPANRLGALMTAGGLGWIVASVANTGVPALIAIGQIGATVPVSIMIHLVLACPSGRVVGTPARLTVATAYFTGLVLQAPLWAFTPEPPPFDVVQISARPDLAELGQDIQRGFGIVVVVATVWLLVPRLRTYDTASRRLLGVLLGYSLVAVVTIPVGADVLTKLGLGNDATAIQLAMVAIVPLAFLVVIFRGGFTRPGELTSLVRSVTSSSSSGHELDSAVAAALGDPSALVLRGSAGDYVDGAGQPWNHSSPHLATVDVTVAGNRLGALVYDHELGADTSALIAVSGVVGIALEREQLARQLADSRAALQESSQRLLAAGDAERRRIARDLHDGLQGALVRLSLQAHQAARGCTDSAADWTDLAEGIDASARDLRDLVDGVMPAPLLERGLATAVRELADDMPVPTRVTVDGPDERLPAQVETTAYFVIAEALTNVVKHANATRVDVVVRRDDDRLCVDVADDGTGGAPAAGGSGLAGLHDRLAVLGGSLTVDSVADGTRLHASMPCGSRLMPRPS